MTKERICAYYSRGPHYVRMLRCLRENYPEATLVAAIPALFPFDAIDGLADETLRLPEAEGGRGLRAGWAVRRELRQAKCTHLVVMFDSPRLNLLAATSGIPQRRCFTVDGRFYRLNHKPATMLVEIARRRVLGLKHYLRAWRGTRKS